MASTSKPSSPQTKKLYATSSPFEEIFGYYRAVRHGKQIFVSGTTAVDPHSPPSAPQILFPGDAKQQTKAALEQCIKAIQALGGKGAQSVLRVKMFVGRHEDCLAVGEGFREVLGKHLQSEDGGQIGTAATMIVVQNGFINKDMLVEIEVDGIAEDSD
jgi:enamine deaminase RidA (YjgF/YER057c/UK114 family)